MVYFVNPCFKRLSVPLFSVKKIDMTAKILEFLHFQLMCTFASSKNVMQWMFPPKELLLLLRLFGLLVII